MILPITGKVGDDVYYDTYDRITIDPYRVRKYGLADEALSCVEAWADFDADPKYDTYDYGDITFMCNYTAQFWKYTARAVKLCLKFDTIEATANPTSAVVRIYITKFFMSDDTTIRVYEHDWGDVVDVGDWGGGTLRGSKEIFYPGSENYNAWVDISIPVGAVNIGGYSKYKISTKGIDDNDRGELIYVYVTLAQLKLGYNEMEEQKVFVGYIG